MHLDRQQHDRVALIQVVRQARTDVQAIGAGDKTFPDPVLVNPLVTKRPHLVQKQWRYNTVWLTLPANDVHLSLKFREAVRKGLSPREP